MNIVDINASAMKMLGLGGTPESVQGHPMAENFQPIDFYNAYTKKCRTENPCIHIAATDRYVSLTVSNLSEQNPLFGLMKDISEQVNYEKKLDKVKADTIATTDSLIMKQMRVVQEVASLLGETTAETKMTLTRLMNVMQDKAYEQGGDSDAPAAETVDLPSFSGDDSALQTETASPFGGSRIPDPFDDLPMAPASGKPKLKINTKYARPAPDLTSGRETASPENSREGAGDAL